MLFLLSLPSAVGRRLSSLLVRPLPTRAVALLCFLAVLGAPVLSSPLPRLRHNDVPSSSPPTALPVHLPSAPSPTCALNGTNCPPPLWAPQWNLTLSTVCQPSSDGYFLPPSTEPWGLISLDWSVAMSIWKRPNMNESTTEATTVENCRLIKATSPGTRCFIYHNMELALQCLQSQRIVMYQPQYVDWFLQYLDAKGGKTGRIYNEPGDVRAGDSFFWDFRNPQVRDFFVNSVVSVVSDPAVDGTFTDDVAGFPEDYPNAPQQMGMNASQIADLQYWTGVTHMRMLEELVKRGKFNWQAFGFEDGTGPSITSSTCLAFMQERCSVEWQSPSHPITMGVDESNYNVSIAAFLITRPPIAYLGFGWESDQANWRSAFLYEVGEPKGGCVQVGQGVFRREWTFGNVTLDCNSYTSHIPTA